MVRLKARQVELKDVDKGNFNSNMVRLKVAPLRCEPMQQGIFQFQYGAIKSLGMAGITLWLQHFNSNMVRLKDATQEQPLWLPLDISIPIWCD